MATKNHFSNYENLFSAYRDSVSHVNNSTKISVESSLNLKRKQLETLEKELKEVNNFINNPTKKVPMIDTRKSQEFLPKFIKQRDEAEKLLADVKAKNVTLSEKEKISLEATIKLEEKKLVKIKSEINSLSFEIAKLETPKNSIDSLKTKITEATKLQKIIETNLAKSNSQIKEDNEKIAKIQTAEENLRNIKAKHKAILLDEKKYTRTARNNNVSVNNEIENKKAIIEELEKELKEVKAKNVTLSKKERSSIEKTIKLEEKRLDKTKSEINSLSFEIAKIDSLKTKITEAINLQKTIETNLTKSISLVKEDNEKLAKIQTAEENLRNIKAKHKAILLDEKKYTRTARNINTSINNEIENKKAIRRKITLEKNKLAKEIEELEKETKAVPTSTTGSIDEFKKFLTDNGFSTVHAEELFELYKNPNHKLSSLTKNEFKLRKQHPKRDRFLKKFLLPTTLTAGGVGLGCGAVASSIATGGSQWLWIQFTSNAAVNFLQAALPGAAFGALAAVSTIALKDALTKLHYNRKYGNANKILNDPQSAKLEELLEKIENTKDDILDLRKGNFFTKLPRAIKRTAKNIVNRNRIHHVESITEKLVEKFNDIMNNKEISVEVKLEKLTPIYDVLDKINNFYAKDIKKSKIFAMLNCKETDKNHSHKETIENLDIYAKLNMYLEKVEKLENVSKSAKKKAHKQVKADLVKQNVVAEKLLNGEQVTCLVAKRYLELVKASDRNQTPASRTIVNYIVTNGDLQVTFKDGKSISYQLENSEQIKNVESVNKGKTLLITYKNGEQASISSTTPKTKINLNVAGEFKVLDKLKDITTFNYLIEKGYSEKTLNILIETLNATKFNKNGKEKAKPSAFMKSKAYKENPEYAKIIKEVADIIKNPNVVNINNGFNA